MLAFLRLLLTQPSAKWFFCALLQDLFVAAELSFLPSSWFLHFLFFLLQWVGILLAIRFEIRLTPSLFAALRSPGRFLDSARESRLFFWTLLGGFVFWIVPQKLPPPLIFIGLAAGPFAALWSRRMDSTTERLSSNPLFYLQWRKIIHPSKRAKIAPYFANKLDFNAPEQIAVRRGTKPHILFLFLESFRAENIGALGAKVGASPCFDALAKEGAFFTNCSATGPLTCFATISSLFGIQPSINTFSMHSYLDQPLLGLPSLLAKAGYHTAWLDGGFASFGSKRPFFQKNGMMEIIGAEDLSRSRSDLSWGVHDERLFRFAAGWLKKQSTPSFATLITLTNHHPWDAPDGWKFLSAEPINPIYQRFLNTFSYTDACLGRFVKELASENLLENTILFITADHGQVMGDGNTNYTTHVNLSQQNLHVPLLLYAPGLISPQIIQTPCSHIDFMPTVLDLLQIKGPHHCLGRSLLRALEQPVYFSLSGPVVRWGCRLGFWKFTCLSNGKEEELFHLKEDLDEKINLVESAPAQAEKLKKMTFAHFESADALFENKAWSDLPSKPEEIFAPHEKIEDRDIKKILKRPFSTIDLSRSIKLTDLGLEKICEKNGKNLRYLILPKSPLITDRTLYSVGNFCPNLSAFTAQDCPLLTNQGVEMLIEKCPNLKLLSLHNSDEITRLFPKVETLFLYSLLLGEAIALEGESLVDFILKCPHLNCLQINIQKASKTDLQKIALSLNHLQELCFYNGENLTKEILDEILRRNPQLNYLNLVNCPKVNRG